MDKIDEILLHLYDSIDYGFSHRAKEMFFISDLFDHQKKEFANLTRQKLITKNKNRDGSVSFSLTEKGKLRALNISFRNFSNKKEKWDGKWRMVAFDIPNKFKKSRDAIRYRMKLGAFYKLQDSLFLCPYDCKKEIMALVELYKLQKYVSFGVLEEIGNNEEIKKKFELE
ncbi:MAG: hypothetical protein ABSA74_02200 [Candidatus Staskawiczbacteria bacterium]|jgi:DNA-binding transcriptional regulator PaaX